MAKKSSVATSTTTREENAIVKYFKDTRAELKKVTWPTREETRLLTIVIVLVTVAMAAFLGILDYVFQILAGQVIERDLISLGITIGLFAAGVAAFYYNNQQE